MKSTKADSGVINKITQFCAGNNDHLIQSEDGSEELIIEPNPRSWEFVSRIENSIAQLSDKFKDGEQKDRIRTELLQGLIGVSITNAYKNWAAELYPNDIMEHGVNSKISQILRTMKRPEMQGLMLGVANVATSMKEPSQKHIENVMMFCKWMVDNNDYRDLAVGFCRSLTNNELESSLKGAALINPSIQRILNKQQKVRIWYNALTNDPVLSTKIQINSWGSEIKLNKK
jgi:inorganic pyrophosphatase/exopolyphosphatase